MPRSRHPLMERFGCTDMTLDQYTITLDDGFRVGVTRGGHGIPLVFLHGFSVAASAYSEMLELLAENGFEVIAIDAPDHGRTDALPWGHTVLDMADVVADALDVLYIDKAVVVGHSMGGWLAAEFAALYPERVSMLILLNAAVGEEFHESIRVGPSPGAIGKVAQFVAGALSDVVGEARKAKSLRVIPERLSLVYRLGASISGPKVMRAAYAMVRCSSEPALLTLRGEVRTAIIHGADDRIIPGSAALSAASSADAQVTLLGGHHHSWMISDPDLAVSVILGTVRKRMAS